MVEEFISTVSIQHQKDSSFMVSIPHRVVKRLNIVAHQEAKVLLDDNKIVYVVTRGD